MEYFAEEDYARLQSIYINKVKHLSSWIWKSNIQDDELSQWLANFKGIIDNDPEHERVNALFLLKQFMFIGIREFRELLKTLYKNQFYKQQIHTLRRSGINDIHEIEKLYTDWLSRTRFIGIGNPSESSSLLLYFFRQVNGLSKELFWHTSDIFTFDENAKVNGLKTNDLKQPILNYIFLDDLIASGQQAIDFFTGVDFSIDIIHNIQHFSSNSATINYYTLFNTTLARERFERELPSVQMKTIFPLDDSYKAYDPISRYFPPLSNEIAPKTAHTAERKYSENICSQYFHTLNLHTDYHCGYRNSQLLLSFFYNTPDNTIPLFWAESVDWKNIVKRYTKIY